MLSPSSTVQEALWRVPTWIAAKTHNLRRSRRARGTGPVENDPEQTPGAWRLLIWAALLVLAISSQSVSPSSWGGLVALWGWTPLLVGIAAAWTVIGLGGYREWRRHTDRLETIPIRIHVDGSRGKTGTCRLIGAALRANGLRVVVKTTGKMPVLIDASGNEKVIDRPPTPTANLREQKEIVRLAAEQHAQAIVVECMAVDPELRRTSENTLIRATLAVITNVRRDHLEVIGPDIGTGARNLSDVIPPNGTVVTAEHRFPPRTSTRADPSKETERRADRRTVQQPGGPRDPEPRIRPHDGPGAGVPVRDRDGSAHESVRPCGRAERLSSGSNLGDGRRDAERDSRGGRCPCATRWRGVRLRKHGHLDRVRSRRGAPWRRIRWSRWELASSSYRPPSSWALR